jgi:hypothetical protein
MGSDTRTLNALEIRIQTLRELEKGITRASAEAVTPATERLLAVIRELITEAEAELEA